MVNSEYNNIYSYSLIRYKSIFYNSFFSMIFNFNKNNNNDDYMIIILGAICSVMQLLFNLYPLRYIIKLYKIIFRKLDIHVFDFTFKIIKNFFFNINIVNIIKYSIWLILSTKENYFYLLILYSTYTYLFIIYIIIYVIFNECHNNLYFNLSFNKNIKNEVNNRFNKNTFLKLQKINYSNYTFNSFNEIRLEKNLNSKEFLKCCVIKVNIFVILYILTIIIIYKYISLKYLQYLSILTNNITCILILYNIYRSNKKYNDYYIDTYLTYIILLKSLFELLYNIYINAIIWINISNTVNTLISVFIICLNKNLFCFMKKNINNQLFNNKKLCFETIEIIKSF